ncbi:unnamed protein product [Phytophthora lilii]|uniref:Unnamed protein product n=1 Tax=Phytophthora lilii TaxID=2077276 RepID=A0A9W6WUM9_9STRA|nr:unnamed protein product [Phytophthora lilii]
MDTEHGITAQDRGAAAGIGRCKHMVHDGKDAGSAGLQRPDTGERRPSISSDPTLSDFRVGLMASLITSDEGLFDDIVGLLDFNGPFTPRPSIDRETGVANSSTSSPSGPDSGSPTSSSASGGHTDSRSSRREKEKNRQRRYRKRLKDSREELLLQVEELSKELNRLNTRTPKRKKTDTDGVIATTRWVADAIREKEMRVESEAEQKQPIAAVNRQAEYIMGLRQVVGYRSGDVIEYGGGGVGSFLCQNNIPTLHSMTSALYMTYLQQLDACYARVDTVMNECGMNTMAETTIRTIHRRKNDGEVAYFQHVNKVALPFNFQQTCDVLWQAVREQDEPAFGGYEIAPDNDVFIKTRVLRALNIGALAQRFISRFYKEEGRLLLVWKMSSEGEGAFSGLHAEETTWLSVRQTPTGVMLEVCAQQVPMRFNLPHSKQPAIDKFYNLLHESLEADKEEMSKRMEKLLISDVLTGIDV